MSAVLEKLSVKEYLEKERNSNTRAEFFQGEERALTGASFIHNSIVANLLFSLKKKLNSSEYKVLSSDMKVWAPVKQVFYYPDVLVLPNPPMFHDEFKDIVTNPVCIFEVISEFTRQFDMGEKFYNYKTIPNFKEYYTVEQTTKNVTQYFLNEKGNWELKEIYQSTFLLPCLGIEISLEDVYEGIGL